MGNPLSPLLAEIFMDNLEDKISKNKIFQKFTYWYRYVDDILAAFVGTQRQLNVFFDFINELHPNINFTMEIESNNSINFLDLTISKHSNFHDFAIFRKPSHTDMVIHNSSYHPRSHKLAAFHSMIHRLSSVPLNNDNFSSELNIIKQIAVNNGYSPKIIDSLLKKKTFQQAKPHIYPKAVSETTKFFTSTFCGNLSQKISEYLKPLNFKSAFKTNNSLGKFIINTKHKTDLDKRSGVYKLSCNSCPKFYIGQSGRMFKTRISEHKASFMGKGGKSSYAEHLISENHSFNDNFSILHIHSKGRMLDNLEKMEINKFKKSDLILNDQLDFQNSPLLNLFINK